jgi:hypothetical protein
MNRHMSLTLGAAAGAMLASAMLPVAVAFADTPVFPDAPGADAFTVGGVTYDPYLGSSTTAGTEGFNALTQGTGTPDFFDTGSGTQDFEVFTPASGSTPAAEVGTIATTEYVTSYDGITNTGFDVTGGTLVGGGTLGTPSVIDVTNFGSGYENIYSDVPTAAGSASDPTDTLVTPFGDYNLSSMVSAFDVSDINPASAFGSALDPTTLIPFDGGTGAGEFTLGDFTFAPYISGPGTVPTEPSTLGFNPIDQGTGTPGFFETGDPSGGQDFQVYGLANGSTTVQPLGDISATENVTSLGNITNTGFDVTGQITEVGVGNSALPAIGTVYDVTNFGSGFENVYTDVPGAAGAAGTVTDSFVTPFGDYNLSDLVSAFDLSALDPGSAFGLGADAAGAAADAAGSIDPLSFLGL